MHRLSISFALVLCLGLITPAGADWLVTVGGDRIETDGPWKVKGKMVIFTLPNGTLSSIRASEVDLEASDAATAEALAEAGKPAEEPAIPKRAAVLVITDEDVRHVDPESLPQESGEEGGTVAQGDDGVTVASWERRAVGNDGAFEIVGTLRNGGERATGTVTLFVTVYGNNRQGGIAGTAQLQAERLTPGESTSFRYPVPADVIAATNQAEAYEAPVVEFRVEAEPAPRAPEFQELGEEASGTEAGV